jgi:hypothetical protein
VDSDVRFVPSEVDVADYCRDPHVRARIHEYAGAADGGAPSAVYLATLSPDDTPFLTWERARRAPPQSYDELAELGGDMARSLWDTRNLLFVFDLDYLNVDSQRSAFAYSAQTFVTLEPTFRAVLAVLRHFGIRPFRLMTGRGYHFLGRIPLTHPIVDALAALLPSAPRWHADIEARRPAGIDATMTARHARAAAGLGLLIEHLSHLVLRQASAFSAVPVVVNGTVVGRGPRGRECVSLDFSHIGDPLDTRLIRVAFGPYQWHRFRPDIFGVPVASLPPLVALPRPREPLTSMLLSTRDLAAGRRLASREAIGIPDISIGIRRVLTSYRHSALAVFHDTFASERSSPPPDVDLPPCVGRAFTAPNDLLLKPEHIQHAVRLLMARGWTARQVADAVGAAYAADCQWGSRWRRIDRQTRAEFDVRVFAGMVATGLDQLIDLNCVSAQEKDVCPQVGCPFDLRIDRDRLREGAAP